MAIGKTPVAGAVRAALFQGPDPANAATVAENLDAIGNAAVAAAAAGGQVLICPEMSATGYNIGAEILRRAEPVDGPIFAAIAEFARASTITIVYGFAETHPDANLLPYNAVSVVNPEGIRVGHYRKTHLYGELDTTHFTPGSDLVATFPLDGLTCGLLICYDIEFAEPARALAQAGVDWIIVPTGLMAPYSVIAERVVPTRAYETQSFVSYVNRCGTENGMTYVGLTCAVGPDGSDLARAGSDEELIIVDLDRGAPAQVRAEVTYASDRRTDLYR